MDDPHDKMPRPIFMRESEPGSPRGGHSIHWRAPSETELKGPTDEQIQSRVQLVDIMRAISDRKRKQGRMSAKNHDRRDERQAG